MTSQPLYTLSEASKMSGISAKALRSLCIAGLLPGVKRNRRGHRILTEAQVNLAEVLIKMREGGFKPRELRKYSRLYRGGASTKLERKAMLTTRKRQIWQEIQARQATIDFIERQEELLS